MEFTKKYPSGLTLVANKINHAYTVVFGVYVDVGSVREDASTNGFSHFIEHLMFKGTNKRSALQISEELEDIGANINAFTSKENTCFYTKSAKRKQPPQFCGSCLNILLDFHFFAPQLQRLNGHRDSFQLFGNALKVLHLIAGNLTVVENLHQANLIVVRIA